MSTIFQSVKMQKITYIITQENLAISTYVIFLHYSFKFALTKVKLFPFVAVAVVTAAVFRLMK